MNTIKAIWAWLTGWFTSEPESTPTVDKSAEKQTAENLQKVEVSPQSDIAANLKAADERQKDIRFTASAIAKYAEKYENNQQMLMEDYSGDPDLFVAAARTVNWSFVVSMYDDSTIQRIRESGTNFQFTDELKRAVTRAVDAESARRAPEPVQFHGMGPDGRLK